jgi:unsaturated rhamnogalacturonyl hydrolase
MKNKTLAKMFTTRTFIMFLGLCSFLTFQNCNAQVNVGLDNWFNRETNAKTGKPFHYLWTDTAWSGYSRWGKIFTDKGAKVSTLERPDAAALSKVNVYIIVDPDTTTESTSPNYILPEDADAIEAWVKKGGVLMILANDGPNCEFTHLNQLSSRFGFTFNHVTLHPVTGKNFEMGASTNLPNHPIFKGVKKIYIKEISSFKTSSPQVKPILTENNQVLMVEVRVGKGLVVALGDPWIYNEYIDHDRLPADFENRKAAENLSDYLIKNAKK